MQRTAPWNIALPLLIVCAGVGYYFGIFLPQENSQKDLAANQSACAQMDDKLSADYNKNLSGEFANTTHHYDTNLHRCIVDLDVTQFIDTSHSVSNVAVQSDTNIETETLMYADEQNSLIECVTTTQNLDYFPTSTEEICTDYRTNLDGAKMATSTFATLKQQYLTQ